MELPAKAKGNRSVSITFGFDKPSYTTRYTEDFPRRELAVASAEEKGSAAKQRETSIVMGDEKCDYSTDTSAAFKDPMGEGRAVRVVVDTKSAHFVLGFDAPSYSSTYREASVPKSRESDAELAKERERQAKVREELRSTHFRLGDAPPELESTARAAMATGFAVSTAERDETRKAVAKRKEELARRNFHFGFEEKRDYGTTNAMPAHSVEGFTRVTRYMHGTNFVLGDEKPDYVPTSLAATGATEVRLTKEVDMTVKPAFKARLAAKVTRA